MLVVASTVWVDYFNGVQNPHTDYLHDVLDSVPIVVGDLILTEVLQGFRADAHFEQARSALEKFAGERRR